MFFGAIREVHTVGSQFFQDVLVDSFGCVVTAVRIYIDDPAVFNLNISSAGYRAAGEDAGMTNFRVRELIKKVEIAGGIHHVVVLIVVFTLGVEHWFPRVVVDESVLNKHSPFFALLGAQIDHSPRLVLSEFAFPHGDRGVFVSLLLTKFLKGWPLRQRCPGRNRQAQCQTDDEKEDGRPVSQLFHELPRLREIVLYEARRLLPFTSVRHYWGNLGPVFRTKELR